MSPEHASILSLFQDEIVLGEEGVVFTLFDPIKSQPVFYNMKGHKIFVFWSSAERVTDWNNNPNFKIMKTPYNHWFTEVVPAIAEVQEYIGLNWEPDDEKTNEALLGNTVKLWLKDNKFHR